MMRDQGYWEAVVGKVVRKENKKPVKGARVEAFDKDLLKDDNLGDDTTDKKGRFRIEFDQRSYGGAMPLFEGRPDIYLKITDPEGNTTKTPVHYEMDGKMEPSKDPEKKGPDGEIEVLSMGVVEID